MKRTEQIPIRVTIEERDRLDKMAASCGMTRSELIRHIVRTTQAELVTVRVLPKLNVHNEEKTSSLNDVAV